MRFCSPSPEVAQIDTGMQNATSTATAADAASPQQAETGTSFRNLIVLQEHWHDHCHAPLQGGSVHSSSMGSSLVPLPYTGVAAAAGGARSCFTGATASCLAADGGRCALRCSAAVPAAPRGTVETHMMGVALLIHYDARAALARHDFKQQTQLNSRVQTKGCKGRLGFASAARAAAVALARRHTGRSRCSCGSRRGIGAAVRRRRRRRRQHV